MHLLQPPATALAAATMVWVSERVVAELGGGWLAAAILFVVIVLVKAVSEELGTRHKLFIQHKQNVCKQERQDFWERWYVNT